MSEKMTETSIKTDMARIQTETDRSEGATMALHRIEIEMDRARASEAEQAKALQEKDATIKALADALELAIKTNVHAMCPFCRAEREFHESGCAALAALRLAGRI